MARKFASLRGTLTPSARATNPQPPSPDMDDIDELRARFEELQREHRDLDAEIARLTSEQPFDQLQVQRLKKRKLALKDRIIELHEQLIPDIIA